MKWYTVLYKVNGRTIKETCRGESEAQVAASYEIILDIKYPRGDGEVIAVARQVLRPTRGLAAALEHADMMDIDQGQIENRSRYLTSHWGGDEDGGDGL